MIPQGIYEYCIAHSSEESEILKKIRRETHLRTLRPQMISGPLQAQLLRYLVKLFKVSRVLEIGTFTGYATIAMADGLSSDGLIYTIELEEELSWFHGQFFNKLPYSQIIKCYYGDANLIIPEIDEQFDFVFMDAGKKDYRNQLDMLLSKMKVGGIILADNVLWKAKVLESQVEQDKMTRQIHGFNQYVTAHSQLENIILPIRDGLNLIMVK